MRPTRRLGTVLVGLLVILAGTSVAMSNSPADFGDPLPGLTDAQLAEFQTGKTEFQGAEDVPDGLGPVFNEATCVACHTIPTVGGGGTRLETRFGRLTNGKFDPMTEFGGSLLQDQGIGLVNVNGSYEYVGETVPAQATIVAKRRTTPLFGLGFVDAVPDATFVAIAEFQARAFPDTAGRPLMVTNLATGGVSIGKFGWKAQVPTLFFAGDAYLNEMGITNPMFPNENCPQGDCTVLSHNPVPGLNDDGTGVRRFANFMTLLAPPPRLPVTATIVEGGVVFASLGCANCHVPALKSGPHQVAALSNKAFFPFSDFLLHDMGHLGDGIEQGDARGNEMRTAPLWGLRAITTFLHDGRATSIKAAILAHDGQAETARDRFNALDQETQAKLLAFLNSI